MDAATTSAPGRRLAGLLALLGYVAIAHSVQQLYPFSVFDMYAHPATSASRLAVRDAGGAWTEVTAWQDWQCPEPLRWTEAETSREAAQVPYSIPYRDREAQAWITGHTGPREGDVAGNEPVALVRHIWWLQPRAGRPEVEDRLVMSCRARRR